MTERIHYEITNNPNQWIYAVDAHLSYEEKDTSFNYTRSDNACATCEQSTRELASVYVQAIYFFDGEGNTCTAERTELSDKRVAEIEAIIKEGLSE